MDKRFYDGCDVTRRKRWFTVRYITKENELLLQKLAELPEYKKSFSLLVNDAIDRGIPELYKHTFGEVLLEDDNKDSKMYEHDIIDEALLGRLTNLLEEMSLNLVLTKSMVCSLFGIMKESEGVGELLKDKLENGSFDKIPEYLEDYEKEALKAVNRE